MEWLVEACHLRDFLSCCYDNDCHGLAGGIAKTHCVQGCRNECHQECDGSLNCCGKPKGSPCP